MPYIEKQQRSLIDFNSILPNTAGQLNYKIHNILEEYVKANGVSYQTYNDMIGALEAAKLELYRRSVSNYEDLKIKENGDIKFYENNSRRNK
jgi:hypothetical protein